MNIGIIGAGNVATGLTKLLAPKGHEVTLSFSRDVAKLEQTAKLFGSKAGTVAEAVAFGDVVVIATPWVATKEAIARAGNPAERKIVWDCTNALKPDMTGLAIGLTTSASEEIQKAVPWARVVKGIPPFAELMHTGSVRVGGRGVGVFVASDDPEAKGIVISLVQDLGADATDGGPLSNARYIEPAAFLLIQLAYSQKLGPKIGLGLLEEVMTLEGNKQFVRNHFERFVNKRDLSVADANFAPDYKEHGTDVPPAYPAGPEGPKGYLAAAFKRFPDIHVVIEDIIAEGDKVVVRNTWRATDTQSNQKIEFSGIVIWRISNRQMLERWAFLSAPQPARRA